MMAAARMLRVALTVSDLTAAEAFYVSALGFRVVERGAASAFFDAGPMRETLLVRGGQTLALQCFERGGAAYPPDVDACDQAFQHFAMPTDDIEAAVAGLPSGARAISSAGAQRLPASSGGATAYKFRDPEGHPLELIQFPDRRPLGIDHTAIVVSDAARSIDFYRDQFGLRVVARQINTGPEQDCLDGLDRVSVDVVALAPETGPPHLELLAYRHPQVGARQAADPRDVRATKTVFQVPGLAAPRLLRDPDQHWLLLVP